MTKVDFKAFYLANRLIKTLKYELENLRLESSLKRGTKLKRSQEQIKKRENELEKRIIELDDLRESVDVFIDSIEEDWIRHIFRLRYIKCMTWARVAMEIGGGNSADGVRKTVERYIAKVEKGDI